MAIDGYFINNFLLAISLMAINAYYWLLYEYLLVDILLMAISSYYIGGYSLLFY